MKIHEFQSKEIFTRYGITVPSGDIAETPEEAVNIYKRLKFESSVIKAQILSGGRGKAGGIIRANSPDEVRVASEKLLGSEICTHQTGQTRHKITRVLVQEYISSANELYMGITINRSEGRPNLIFSAKGGVDIEEISIKDPTSIHIFSFLPSIGIEQKDINGFFSKAGVSNRDNELLSDTAIKLSKIFIQEDCLIAEINPLFKSEKHFMALDAKIVLDDTASFRRKGHEDLRDPDEDSVNEKRARECGLSYVPLEGNVGCLVNGAGLAMATMDAIKIRGGNPANFLDVGGGADLNQVLEGLRIILSDKNVSSVLINIFGGIMKCDIIAKALVETVKRLNVKIPLVVRFEGTRHKEAFDIMSESGIKFHTARTLDEGAKFAAELSGN